MGGYNGHNSRRNRRIAFATWGTDCHLCGKPGATTADHIIPRSEGGRDLPANLRPAHASCNYARGTMPLTEWFATHPLPTRPALAPSRAW